jgi:hypothetical protein
MRRYVWTPSRKPGNCLRCMSRVAVLVGSLITASSANADPVISDNDVSWLFPAPHSKADLDNLIAVKNLVALNVVGEPQLWSPAAFQDFVSLAETDVSVREIGFRIGLPVDAHTVDVWYVAGVRFDPGAPGLSPAIAEQFGQFPEIRLIVQPVSVTGTTVTIHDYAAHLIYDFLKPVQPNPPAQLGCAPKFIPDTDAFNSVVTAVFDLKNKLAAGTFGAPIPTTGPLDIHPGLQNAATRTQVVQAMKTLLETHLSPLRLDAMSVVGTPANAEKPWIFLSMRLPPGSAHFVPVPSPALDGSRFAIALDHPKSSSLTVLPMLATNNGVVATCKSGALGVGALPPSIRHGVSTADLFSKGASVSKDEVTAVTATIADPDRSHFFNTDCASCHTETRLLMQQGLSPTGLTPAVLTKDSWVVRNFGWSPSGQAIATRRTEAETHAIVQFLSASGNSR